MTILEKVKGLLGIADDQHDAIINTIITMMTDEVLIFTNRNPNKPLPLKVESVIAQMVADYFRVNPSGIKQLEGNDIKSISRGDTSITYVRSEASSNIQTIIQGYHSRLIPLRLVVIR